MRLQVEQLLNAYRDPAHSILSAWAKRHPVRARWERLTSAARKLASRMQP